ncbi:sensor domain-containing diguanylate cyclase [Gayadomonas joobiniege]|uniref:sensor domain-containing diguanylate cyclase n=1 Tax=Gayadomonas joobiniege TaxID=1234606 RepID=UPI00192CAF60|nr:sensor domain-containing diguanylate cyclase [Gayadomonas joobiniege]
MNDLQVFVNGLASSVAIIKKDKTEQFFITACNELFFDMVGGRRSVLREFPFPLESVIPSYTRRDFIQKVRECFDTGEALELEQAYDLKDSTHWWRLSLKPFHFGNNSDDVNGVMITGLDITAKILLQHQLEVSTSRFRSVVNAAYDAIVTIDQQHRITLFNRAAEDLFGYSQDEVLDQPIEKIIPMEYRKNHSDYIHKFARSPVRSRQMDERNRVYGLHQDGSKIPVEIAISKINVDGLLEFTAVIRDITDRVHLMDLLEKQAATDPLTGLPNRREFTALSEDFLKEDRNFSLLIMDVDKFKLVNDNYGHDVGDEVLRALAKVGCDTVRHKDVFARLGGEEFVLAMPNTDLEQAKAMAERLRKIYADKDFDFDWQNEAVPFTVSIGVAACEGPNDSLANMLKRADIALYQAKETGRNKVVW